MSFADKTLTCVDCGSEFVFTAGEQEFHASKGFTNEPRRCVGCRAARRAQRGGSDSYSAGGSSGGSSGGYGMSSVAPRREFFTATCAGCGGQARVPFEPRGDRPVYCSDCFRAQPRQTSSYGRNDRW